MTRSQTVPKPPPLSDAQQRELTKRASRIINGAAHISAGLIGIDAARQLFLAAAADLQDLLDDIHTRQRGPADGFEPLR